MTTGRAVAIVAGVAAVSALAFTAVIGAFRLMKRTDAYRTAETFLAAHPRVKAIAGEDLRFGAFPTIKIRTNVSRETGEASIVVPISGPLGATVAYVALEKEGGSWKVVRAVCRGKNGGSVELKSVAAADRSTASVEATDHLHRAYELHRAQKWEESLLYYDAALALEPDNAEAIYFRGEARAKTGRLELALVDFLRAIQLDPDRIDAYRYSAWVQAQRGEWEAIAAQWTRYIERHPNSGEAYCERARARRRSGDAGDALRDAEQACRLGSETCCSMARSTPARS